MLKSELYRIKKGKIISDDKQIAFDFGLIFSKEGIIEIDLYINESFNLVELVENRGRTYWEKNYNIKCLTESNNEIEIDKLRFRSINPNLSKIQMVCYGKMTHFTISKIDKDKKKQTENNIHYIELEGLRMEFCDITEETKTRRGKVIDNFGDKRDHTLCTFISNEFTYDQIYYKKENSDNIIVEFVKSDNYSLSYEQFSEIKNNYISALSLLNGAKVSIRNEYTGSYYAVGKIDSEIVITHSFKEFINERYNHYIPLDDPFSRGSYILSKFFTFCFDNYKEWNDKIDLNTIIFYLNNSQQAQSMEEKFFIQMIAFERMTTIYAEYIGIKEEFLPNNEDFQVIKNELIEVISHHKEKFGNAYHTIKGKLSNLNQIKRLSTTDKMFRLINDLDIAITPQIESLINIVRHKTIHKGDIGKGEEGIYNFLLLDELINEIILRLVKYNGPRSSRALLNTKKQ